MSLETSNDTVEPFRRPVEPIKAPSSRKNGGFDLAHFAPQTPKQRIAAGLLQLVFEEGLEIGEFLFNDPKSLCDTPTEATLCLLRWAHHEVETPASASA
jgi:hypothetical protein